MIECTVYYLKKFFTTPHLDSHSTTDPKPEILSAVLTGNRISHDGRNVRGIMHVHMCRKDDIFRQRRLNHSGVGGGIAFRKVYPARAYSTVVVLVYILLVFIQIQIKAKRKIGSLKSIHYLMIYVSNIYEINTYSDIIQIHTNPYPTTQ